MLNHEQPNSVFFWFFFGGGGDTRQVFIGHLQLLLSVEPMGNVTKYLQKLVMGVYNNENHPGVSRKPEFGETAF